MAKKEHAPAAKPKRRRAQKKISVVRDEATPQTPWYDGLNWVLVIVVGIVILVLFCK